MSASLPHETGWCDRHQEGGPGLQTIHFLGRVSRVDTSVLLSAAAGFFCAVLCSSFVCCGLFFLCCALLPFLLLVLVLLKLDCELSSKLVGSFHIECRCAARTVTCRLCTCMCLYVCLGLFKYVEICCLGTVQESVTALVGCQLPQSPLV